MSLLGFDALGRWALGQLPGNGSAVLVVTGIGAVMSAGSAPRFAIASNDVSGSYAIAGMDTPVRFGMPLGGGAVSYAGGGNAFSVFEAESAGGFAVALGTATVDLIGSPLVPAGGFRLDGVAASFSVTFGPAAGPFAATGLATGFSRDFINWLPQPFATQPWDTEPAPQDTWRAVTTAPAGWNVTPAVPAQWSLLSAPSGHWTADPAQQILPPVDS